VKLAKAGKLDSILAWDGVRGIFHNHTTRSDGTASLEEMVIAAKKQGFQYIGISDHSQSAFYASGLKTDALLEQEKEIRKVQDKHPDIRIFWGIESDILADGSLDYPESMLKRFDFVVASVHSRFQMDKEAMTDRILEAIRNPHTRFLGHATGRILLGRKGYDLHMEKIIAEAAACDVAIELNANPARLDIDWRWGPELRKHGTKISVNPDAHATDEIVNTRFGIMMARKALLPASQVVNGRSVKEVEKWLARK
jgi:DNA polymerase (family 10)